jgi:hypothetical protein
MYQMLPEIFSKFLINKKFAPVQISKKTFFEYFSLISWVLCTVTKFEKVVLSGFSTGTKMEFRIFEIEI